MTAKKKPKIKPRLMWAVVKKGVIQLCDTDEVSAWAVAYPDETIERVLITAPRRKK